MAYIPLEKLLRNVGSLYMLVMAGAKRSTELSQGAAPLVPPHYKKVTSIALQEIAEEKIHFEQYQRESSAESAKRKESEKESS